MKEELERLGVLAATMGADARVYHVGFVVPALDAAMTKLGEALGIVFTEPMNLPFTKLQTPDGERDVALRFAYSTRPVHIELIAAAPGTLWDFATQERGHHVGVWADDVESEATRLESLGMPRVWWASDLEGRPAFSYHETPFGFYIELVGAAAKAFYPDWFRAAEEAGT